jgi:amino acid transporter
MAVSSPDSTTSNVAARRTIGDMIVGPARDIRDPNVFHKLSLVAFLAWVGLGSDGLSSSCYGPQEAFLALGPHRYLAVFLALVTALTVFVISASYSQTIDLFPSGGGGYLVATRLLGKIPGLISGSALVVDYVLTVSVSIASGADAIFSFLPAAWLAYKLIFCMGIVLVLVSMNLRGVKESVLTLVPIFLAFVLVHSLMILYAVLSRAAELPQIMRDAVGEVHRSTHSIGMLALAIIFLRAYSLGGGTYTGIEAVSNGLPILREPRAATGKRTMVYMAISLSFIAGGILVSYLLAGVEPEHGKTLNAVLFSRLALGWHLGGLSIGAPIVTFALLTEGALLFVAAQTGFLDGPRVMATMATDRWLPRRFANLSGRLVIEDGILAMGACAAGILFFTGARVDTLVILYAINVFLTFTLSQLGMVAHWWQMRKTDRGWPRRILINGLGCLFTASILLITLSLKFYEGGWVTVLLTGTMISLCVIIRGHYDRISRVIAQLEVDILPQLFAADRKPPPLLDRAAPTAVMLVNGFNGLGLATLISVCRLFEDHFKNAVFVRVAEVDSAIFKGKEEVEARQKEVADDLNEYSRFARDLGLYPEVRAGLGTDSVQELRRLCSELSQEFVGAVFFAGKLVFSRDRERFMMRFLHNHTALELQSYLQTQGISLVILPVRVAAD